MKNIYEIERRKITEEVVTDALELILIRGMRMAIKNFTVQDEVSEKFLIDSYEWMKRYSNKIRKKLGITGAITIDMETNEIVVFGIDASWVTHNNSDVIMEDGKLIVKMEESE